MDTHIWSFALRSQNQKYKAEIDELAILIRDHRALIIGPIRQEVLSGYSDPQKFKMLQEKLSFFDNTPIVDSDYESAAELCNKCRKKGIQGSHTDFLICAVAGRLDVPIFTTDNNFLQYQEITSTRLYEVQHRS